MRKGYPFPMLAKKLIPTLPTTLEKAKMTDFCKRKTPQSATFQNILYEETRELYSPVVSLLASSIPFAVADRIFKSFSLMPSSMVSS